MTMRHSSQVGEASVKNKKPEMASTNRENFEGAQRHEDISGYGAQGGLCMGEGGLVWGHMNVSIYRHCLMVSHGIQSDGACEGLLLKEVAATQLQPEATLWEYGPREGNFSKLCGKSINQGRFLTWSPLIFKCSFHFSNYSACQITVWPMGHLWVT